MGVSEDQQTTRFRFRHVAGPNAGDLIDLEPGTTEFGLAPDLTEGANDGPTHVAFTVDVAEAGVELTSRLLPQHAHLLTLDDDIVEGSTTIRAGQSIMLANDVFLMDDLHAPKATPTAKPGQLVVAPLPDEPQPTPAWWLPAVLGVLLVALLWVSFKDLSAWPLLVPGALLVLVVWWQGRRRLRSLDDFEKHRTRRADRFREDLIAASRAESERRRAGSVGADAVSASLRSGVPLATDASIALAFGEARWQPTLDERGPIDASIEHELDVHGRAHGVPLGLDIGNHLVGIVGPRATALAVVRHLVASVVRRQSAPTVVLEASPTAITDWAAATDLTTLTRRRPGSRTYTIIDGVGGTERPTAGVMISATTAGLRHEPDIIVTIASDGFATVRVTSTGRQSARMAPIGISAQRFRELVGALPAPPAERAPEASRASPTPDSASPTGATNAPEQTNPILVTAATPDLTLGQLTALALNVHRHHGSRPLLLLVLDRPDRSLEGLKEIGDGVRLLQAHEPDAVRVALAECAAAFSERRPVAFLANDLGRSLHDLATRGHRDLTDQIVTVLRACSLGHGFAAVAEPIPSSLPPNLLNRFPVRIEHHAGEPWLIDHRGRRLLTRRSLKPGQVASVICNARIA